MQSDCHMFEFCRNQHFDIFVCKGWRREGGWEGGKEGGGGDETGYHQ